MIGVMAAWSVLGVYLSLFPSFAGERTRIHSLVFVHGVGSTTGENFGRRGAHSVGSVQCWAGFPGSTNIASA